MARGDGRGEKTQIQALSRTQPLLPLRPGLPARQTHDQEADHKRHCSDHGGDLPPALLNPPRRTGSSSDPERRRRRKLRLYIFHNKRGATALVPYSATLNITESSGAVDTVSPSGVGLND